MKLVATPYGQLSVHTLLVATAIYIEDNPHLMNYWQGSIPREGEAGCPLALLGGIAGFKYPYSHSSVARGLLGVGSWAFWWRMQELLTPAESDYRAPPRPSRFTPQQVATCLRRYADAYHAER